MNFTLDIGNTLIKWATFEGSNILRTGLLSQAQLSEGKLQELLMACAPDHVLAAVSGSLPHALCHIPTLSPATALPIKVNYNTPQTLGADRVAAAVGAFSLLPPHTPALIIDAGTCITVDYLSADGTYQGGAILPGLSIQFRALHDHTAALPLVTLDQCTDWDGRTIGKDTLQSLMAGVITSTRFALEQFVLRQRQLDPLLQVFVTGGDAERVKPSFSQIVPHLLFFGLNAILNYNESSFEPLNI